MPFDQVAEGTPSVNKPLEAPHEQAGSGPPVFPEIHSPWHSCGSRTRESWRLASISPSQMVYVTLRAIWMPLGGAAQAPRNRPAVMTIGTQRFIMAFHHAAVEAPAIAAWPCREWRKYRPTPLSIRRTGESPHG